MLFIKKYKKARQLKDYLVKKKSSVDSICKSFDDESGELFVKLLENRKKYVHNYTRLISPDEQYFITYVKKC